MYNKIQINGRFNIYTYNGGNNGRIIECGDYIQFLKVSFLDAKYGFHF